MSFIPPYQETAAILAAQNPLVPRGVIASETDTGVMKVGDGVTRYNSLPVALNSIYAPRPGAGAGTGVVIAPAATDAAIRAAAAAVAAAGGGTVLLPPTSVTLTSPLPLLAGVKYRGVAPVLAPTSTANLTWLEDMEWTYVSGSVLVGDGTFSCFEANSADLGSVGANPGAAVIRGAGVSGVGLDNFTYGIRAGAVNLMGVAWSSFSDIWIKNCSQWAVWLANFAHCDFGRIRACLSQNGMYFATLMPGATFAPGNSVFSDELYVLNPRDGRDNRLCRGVVFDAAGTAAGIGALSVARVQVNDYNRALLSVSATFTNTSTAIAVPDGTKFAAGMLVRFTTTANGVTANQVYVVLSVSSNNITIANSRTSTAITATGSSALTLESYGFANVEVTSQNSGAAVNGCTFHQLDCEGSASAALYVENANTIQFTITAAPAAGNSLSGIVARNATVCRYNSLISINTDFDANSSTATSYYGIRSGSLVQRVGQGIWRDGTLGTSCLSLNGAGTTAGGDLNLRVNNFMYPAAGMGEKVFTRDTTITLNASNMGDVIFNGATGQTLTLPTIVTDTTPASSHIGCWFDFVNVSANSVTVATDGTQLFNNVGAKTSLTVATQTGLRVLACKTGGGTLFWMARAYSLA